MKIKDMTSMDDINSYFLTNPRPSGFAMEIIKIVPVTKERVLIVTKYLSIFANIPEYRNINTIKTDWKKCYLRVWKRDFSGEGKDKVFDIAYSRTSYHCLCKLPNVEIVKDQSIVFNALLA